MKILRFSDLDFSTASSKVIHFIAALDVFFSVCAWD
jgi:hypothetical protein